MSEGLPRNSEARRDSVLCDIGGRRGAVLARDALSSTVSYSVPLETVQLEPGASGITGIAVLDYAPVCDFHGVKIGSPTDTSFSWAVGACLDVEVAHSPLTSKSDDEFLATLNPGEYAIDYALGKIFYCKKDSTDTEQCSYYTRQQSLQVRSLCENLTAWEVNVYTISSFGTGQQLPEMAVPNGMKLVIRAHPDNAGFVYLSHSKVGAESGIPGRIKLAESQAVELHIANADLVWWDASEASQQIEVYQEIS